VIDHTKILNRNRIKVKNKNKELFIKKQKQNTNKNQRQNKTRSTNHANVRKRQLKRSMFTRRAKPFVEMQELFFTRRRVAQVSNTSGQS